MKIALNMCEKQNLRHNYKLELREFLFCNLLQHTTDRFTHDKTNYMWMMRESHLSALLTVFSFRTTAVNDPSV